jgi:hypothetical protein
MIDRRRRASTWVLLALSFIGVAGEAGLLWHALVECLPFKAYGGDYSSEPIAHLGVVFGPLVAILFASRRPLLAPSIATMLCPLIFAFLFVGAQLVHRVDWSSDQHFERMTEYDILFVFLGPVIWLAGIGGVIGAICSIAVRFTLLRNRTMALRKDSRLSASS